MAQSSYSRLNDIEREIICKGLAVGKYQKDIAEELTRDPSTISREIRREGMTRSTYSPLLGGERAREEGVKRRKKYKLYENKELAKKIEEKILEKWSPQQICGDLKRRSLDVVSHETIYRYIYSIEDKEHRELLVRNLRRRQKKRKRRGSVKGKRTTIRNLVSIHERPAEVEPREVPGHWEGDLIIGKDHKSAIGTLVERTSRYAIIISFEGRHASRVGLRGAADEYFRHKNGESDEYQTQ